MSYVILTILKQHFRIQTRKSNYTYTTRSFDKTTDYGRPMKPFFIEIQNFRADKFWGIWGIFGQTISTQFGTVSPLSIISAKN